MWDYLWSTSWKEKFSRGCSSAHPLSMFMIHKPQTAGFQQWQDKCWEVQTAIYIQPWIELSIWNMLHCPRPCPACKQQKSGRGLGTRLGAGYMFNSPASQTQPTKIVERWFIIRGRARVRMDCWFKPWITAGFVTVCCFIMSMVSKTLCSHFSGKGSCTCLNWTG